MRPIYAAETARDAIRQIGDLHRDRGLSIPIAAELIGVHNVHIYNGLKGDVSPKLEEALRRAGIIPPKPKRRRLHYEAGYDEDRFHRVQEAIRDLGFQSLTEFVDHVLDLNSG